MKNHSMKKYNLKMAVTGVLTAAVLTANAFPAFASEEQLHKMYGIVNDHGIEFAQQGFSLTLPEDFEIENRGEITLNGETSYLDPNEDKTMEALDISGYVFNADNDYDYITIRVADPGYGYEKWDEVSVVAKNSCDKFVKDMAEDADYDNGQGTSAEETFLGQPCYVNRYTCTLYGDPFYRTTIFLMSEDQQYLTNITLDSWFEDDSETLISCFSRM